MIVADDKVVASFLQNSESRRLRQMLFETYYSRAAENQKNVYGKTNLETIRDLTEMRKRQSKFLGYKNFAEMAIEGKSAASLENVIDLMEKYVKKFIF
jgi:oligopeptidase A